MSPSARTSKGFLISATRVAPSSVQFKHTISGPRRGFVSEWPPGRVYSFERIDVTDFPETPFSLIVQLRTPVNCAAWERFVELYRPVIFRLARGRGLQEADAQDLAQKVLLAVATAVGDGERSDEIVHFRRWLRRVAHNAIINALSRRPIDLAAGGTTVQEILREHREADPDSDAAIELEYRRELYRRASRIVQRDVEPETWRAFEMTVLEDRSVEETAALLGKPAGSIYAARSRIMRRLREAVRELEEENES